MYVPSFLESIIRWPLNDAEETSKPVRTVTLVKSSSAILSEAKSTTLPLLIFAESVTLSPSVLKRYLSSRVDCSIYEPSYIKKETALPLSSS